MRVLLADDEPKVRSALRLILEQYRKVEVVEEVVDAQAMTDRLNAMNPDLLLLDWELPGLHSGPSIADLLNQYQSMKVIVLSGRAWSDRCQVPQVALASGADAFVSKCDPPERLFATLHDLGAD